MKNRRNIVEQKYPPENPNDIWLKDGKFYRSTSEGWVAIGSEIKYTNKESMIADKPEGGTIGIDKETGETSIYNDVAEQWSPLGGGGGGMTETTWQELKDKRDAGKLIPGALYRITDYNCTTTQENTQSAGHQFDIVLLALSENKLAEEGWAMMHDNIYDVTFKDGVTKKCYLYNPIPEQEDTWNIVDVETLLGLIGADITSDLLVNEETKTATERSYNSIELTTENVPYNYFYNSNLSAWKVWYCLDNDKSRFAWADRDIPTFICNTQNTLTTLSNVLITRNYDGDSDGRYGYIMSYEDQVIPIQSDRELKDTGDYTTYFSENAYVITHVEVLSSSVTANGRGVIYRLIDEWNNDCPYDFKNIQFIRKLNNGVYDTELGSDTWVYTFNIYSRLKSGCFDESVVVSRLDDIEVAFVYSGITNNYISDITEYTHRGYSNDNVVRKTLPNNVVTRDVTATLNGTHDITIINSIDCTLIEDASNIEIRDSLRCEAAIQLSNTIALRCKEILLEPNSIYINNNKVAFES